MFLYLKIAGGFEQKSSRLIEAHVHKVYCNIKFQFFELFKRHTGKRSKLCMYITILWYIT